MDRGPSQAAFVGRGGETDRLAGLLRLGTSGRGQLVFVEGEAGIGKTRLLDEVLAGAGVPRMEVLRGCALDLERRRPFGVVADCFGIHRGADGERGRIAALLHPTADAIGAEPVAQPPSQEFTVVEEVVALVEQLCARAPTAVVLEDLQWADPSSVVVLHRLARVASELPIVVIGTFRPMPRSDDLSRLLVDLGSLVTTVRLGPLEARSVAALAEDLLGAPPSTRLQCLLASAGGNPLFVVELLRALRAGGAIDTNGEAEVESMGLPPSLPLTILHALGFLPPAAREVLRIASVLGPLFTAQELAAVAGRPVGELVEPIRAAVHGSVLAETDDGRLVFRHDMIREALYQDLPETLRRALHSDAARVLESRDAPSLRVAEHVIRGERGGDQAVSWLYRAAREAAPASPGTAVELLDRALELASPSYAARDRLLADRAVNLLWSGRVAAAEATSRELLEGGRDPYLAASLRLCLAQALVAEGRAAEAFDHFSHVTAAKNLTEATRARATAWEAHARWLSGDFDGAVTTAAAARALAAAAGDTTADCIAMAAIAGVEHFRGNLARSAALAEEATRLADRSGDPEVFRFQFHVFLAGFQLECDRIEDADAALRRGRQLSKKVGAAWHLAYFDLIGGGLRYLVGDWDDAIAELEAAIQASHDIGSGHTAMARSARSMIAVHRNELAVAKSWVEAAEDELAVAGAQYRWDWVPLARALLYEAEGDLAAAVSVLADTWGRCASAGLVVELPVLGPDLVRLAMATGRRDLAADVAGAVDVVAAANPRIAWVEGAAWRCRGLALDDPEVLLRSVAAYRRGPRPFPGAQAAEDAAAALARTGRAEEARPLLDQACAIYERLGAARGLAQAEARLRALGVRRGRRGPRRAPATGWASLTATEQAVVELVGLGLSNPEIAERMFLSRRTVQTHVSHVLGKLGLSSRVEVAAEVARRLT